MIVIDSYGRIIKWNPEAESLFGWSSAEATGKLLNETIIPAQYRDAHDKGLGLFLKTGQSNIIG
ncbi:MAG: PAS domain-containing protein [Bacteroidota bacterium]